MLLPIIQDYGRDMLIAAFIVLLMSMAITAHATESAAGQIQVNPIALEQDIQAAILGRYMPQWGALVDESKITCEGLPLDPITLRGSRLKTTIELSTGHRLSGRTLATVTLESETARKTLLVPVHTEIKQTVWVLKTPLAARQDIQPGNIQRESRWSDTLEQAAGQDSLQTQAAIISRRARLNLRAGSVLTTDNTDLKPAVTQHNTVTLLLTLPHHVVVKTQGTALENAQLGSNVRVLRTLGNQKRLTYSGIVVRENTVRVDL